VSARIKHLQEETEWWLTTVYRPSRDEDKPAFLTELHDLRQVRTGPWMLAGDFNKIYCTQDKNNDRLNTWLMGQFRCFLNDTSLQEAHLNGRLFTRSNKRKHPTLERIDCVFFTNEWEAIYPGHDINSLVSLCSDHTPLLLRNTMRFLKSWSNRHVGNVKSQLEICKEVVHRLEVARDRHQLLVHEEQLWRELELKSLTL
jgi:hypothetical protein